MGIASSHRHRDIAPAIALAREFVSQPVDNLHDRLSETGSATLPTIRVRAGLKGSGFVCGLFDVAYFRPLIDVLDQPLGNPDRVRFGVRASLQAS
jgi:hypothetical protein